MNLNTPNEDGGGPDGGDSDGGNSDVPTLSIENADSFQYNMRYERLPDLPIYNSDLQSNLSSTKTGLQDVYNILNGHSLASQEGSIIQGLCQEAEDVSSFNYEDVRTVGFIGDSGVGKLESSGSYRIYTD
jgi:hypothetical protein